jgi:hypothetical protein
MINLKNRLLELRLFILFLSGCTSNSIVSNSLPASKEKPIYEKMKRDDRIVILNMSSDRILPFCDKLENGNDGFMVMILDEENTVLVATGRQSSHKTCLKWIIEIQNIAKDQPYVKLVGLGEFEGERVKEQYAFTFPAHGTFHSNGRSFGLHALLNKDHQCFSIFSKTCAKEDFALKIDVFQL